MDELTKEEMYAKMISMMNLMGQDEEDGFVKLEPNDFNEEEEKKEVRTVSVGINPKHPPRKPRDLSIPFKTSVKIERVRKVHVPQHLSGKSAFLLRGHGKKRTSRISHFMGPTEDRPQDRLKLTHQAGANGH